MKQKKMKQKISLFLLTASLMFGALTGCQSSPKTQTSTPAAQESASPADTSAAGASEAADVTDTSKAPSATDGTVTVTDARGQVEIPASPKRIVDLSGNSDILYILGYTVVGTANSDAYDYTRFPSYLETQLAGAQILGYSMQDTMDIEGILSLEPDLIIISGVQEKMYAQLQQIAPTVMVELAQINWKDDIRTFADLMKQETAAEAWLTAYEEKAAAKGNEIKAAYGEDTTYLAMLASGGQLFVFDAAGIGSVIYDDMGLAKPANMPEQDNISLPVIAYEGLAEIDADHIFIVATNEDLESLKQNSIYNSLRAVKEGNVTELPSSPYFNIGYSCIGRDLFLDEFSSLLEK